MLSKRIPDDDDAVLAPAYARRALRHPVPRYEMPDEPMDPGDAYRLIHDELALDGNPELNLATFVTTWMDEEADRLMTETANKNAIDWDEYPQTVELQDRCVNMLARLFHAPDTSGAGQAGGNSAGDDAAVGTATVGSSEAIHLAGLAMKWRWRKARQAKGLDHQSPNIVMGANVQVCWEKFARYIDVEPRYVPLTDDRFVIGVPEAMALVDDHTIGVVGILGSTYTGEYEPIAELDAALDARCAELGVDVPIHVDAASGGFVAPFLQPDLEWDFRLSRVRSINVSGHKYGLVYPGVGWVVWRSAQDLPGELVFTVDYLGGSHSNFGLNFSRGAAQIVAQYYSLIRLGKRGYQEVMEALAATAGFIAGELESMGPFHLVGKGTDLPVVCCRVDAAEPFDVFALSDELRRRGWIVPAYRMAPDAEDVAVLRVVVREGLSMDMATQLVKDVAAAVTRLRDAPESVQHGAEPVVHQGEQAAPAERPAGAPAAGGRHARPKPPARATTKTAGIC
jgi:glutamate decarboxylase